MVLSARLQFSAQPELKLNAAQLEVRDRIQSKIDRGDYAYEEAPCFCGEQGGIPIAERDRYGLAVKTLLCMNCGLMRTSPRLTADSLNRFYVEDYRALYSGALALQGSFDLSYQRGQFVVKKMPSLMAKVQTVFDIGCGTGGLLTALRDIGKEVAGCDLNDEYFSFAQKNGLDVIRGGAEDLLKHRGTPADLVVLSHVLEHFTDLESELVKAVSALRPEGFLLVLVPGIRDIAKNDYKGNLLLYLQNAHNFHFTAKTLDYVLRSIGLLVVGSDEQGAAVAVKPENWDPSMALRVALPQGEALSILAFLADTERQHLTRKEEAMNDGAKMKSISLNEAWPLNTAATLRVLAWPRYEDIESLKRVLIVAEPLYDNKNACLCLRYDANVDIQFGKVQEQLSKAHELVGHKGDLNILFVDDPISDENLPRLGKAITCVIDTDPEIDALHSRFVSALGVEIISGKK